MEAKKKKAEADAMLSGPVTRGHKRRAGQDDGAPPAAEDIVMGNDTPQPQAPVDDAPRPRNPLKILMDNAIHEFGLSARDVYDGVFNLPDTRDLHNLPKRSFDLRMLRDLVDAFTKTHDLDGFSNKVVAVYPVPGPSNADRWEIDFKSTRIKNSVMDLSRLKEDKELREMYDYFKDIPGASSLAGWIFEALARR